MNKIKQILAGATSLLFASISLAEDASLSVTVTDGVLEIEPISSTINPNGGNVVSSGFAQSITFEINNITMNDFLGDGQGFIVTAVPGDLSGPGTNIVPAGTYTGFHNPEDGDGSASGTNNTTLTYVGTAGVIDYTADFDVDYTVPAFATTGTYTGTVSFSIAAP